MLQVNDIHAYYGASHVLQGVTLEVPDGGIVALIGRNGAGKTTTMKTIMGLLPCRAGTIKLKGQEIQRLPTHRISRQGISFIPENRGIIPGLSVAENLHLAVVAQEPAQRAAAQQRVERMLEYFPRLKERLSQEGTSLSGGEQQMLAVARAFVSGPSLLLVDEPTQGLAPMFVSAIMDILVRVNREEGVSVLLVEQNASLALEIAHHAYIMDQGVICQSGPAAEIKDDQEIQKRYLGA